MTTLDKLKEIANNLWWSWHPEALELFERCSRVPFAENPSPVAVLKDPDSRVLNDPAFAAEVDAAHAALRKYVVASPTIPDAPSTAYFCMEYGLHESLSLYSGGLGILAGDHAKAAADLGLPFTAVGLFLREGYFQQSFNEHGEQQADFPGIDPEAHPLTLVTDEDGEKITVTVRLGDETLHLQAWEIALGRNSLYLLDSERNDNPERLRALTRRLYHGDRRTRIRQEIALGIGGVRLLRRLDLWPEVYHLNEGHCAFLTFELLRERLDAGSTRVAAEDWVRDHCVFTTHTPVPAGHDRFEVSMFNEHLGPIRENLGLSNQEMLAYGRINPDQPSDEGEPFNMTVLGLKLSRQANGVSQLNGAVARQQWHGLYPDRNVDDVPIGSITNGVHLPTWTVPPARQFLRQHLGDWMSHRTEPTFWEQIDEVPDETLWKYRNSLRRRLLQFAEQRALRQSLPQDPAFDPHALTIGFARRFATYKRATLLFSDLERAAELFANTERPIQLFYAGKAHAEDEGGKKLIKRIWEVSQQEPFRGKLIFLENYDMAIGRHLVSGCDAWLNNPRRPYEASGTSGQKIALHGGLNCSILDGWWPEGFSGDNGWAIGAPPTGHFLADPEEQDPEDAQALYQVLEDEVIPTFYERDENDLPAAWLRMIRNAMRTLPAPFSAKRMVTDYVEQVYKQQQTVELVK